MYSVKSISAQDNKFYLGEKISGIYIITDKNGKKVFAQIKKIQRTDTNELVYCTQPGTVLSNEEYLKYDADGYSFRLNSDTTRRISLIAHYGYMYENHTDIKWYAITQFMIWKEVLPDNWDLYFTNSNKVRNDSLFQSEIDEINTLVKNHQTAPNVYGNYSYNFNSDIKIFDNNNLINNYNFSIGESSDNTFVAKDLLPGVYNIEGVIKSFKTPIFYHHESGQDVFDKGDVIDKKIRFNINIMGGKFKINECDQETLEDVLVGGTYEVLDDNDNIIYKITCNENEECLSSYLPVGNYKIKVVNSSDEYLLNEKIYTLSINDGIINEQSICFMKKNKEEEKNDEISFETEDEMIEENKNDETEEIYIPSTHKNVTVILVTLLTIISSIGIYLFFHENYL